MMIRKIAILVLLVVITATAVAGIFLYKQKQKQEQLDNHLYMAEAKINTGDYEEALVHLKPLVGEGKSYDKSSKVLYQLAFSLQQTDPKEAYTYWDQLVREYPEHEYFDDARLYQARMLAETSPNDALAIYEELKNSKNQKISGEALLGIAKTYDQNSEAQKAEELYYSILALDTLPEIIAAAKDRLTEINTQKLWSPVLDEFSQLYTVEKGDVLLEIGNKFESTAYYIKEANNIKSYLQPGRRIKVPAERLRVIVDKTNCRLNVVTMSGKFVKWYPVGVGEQSYKTPAGEYSILDKTVNPVWYKPGGGIVKHGDPENALGTRWLALGNSLGIHGTNQPETVGYRKSAGCIRMYNQDVEEIYKLIRKYSLVTITETPEQMKAALQPKVMPKKDEESTEGESIEEEAESSS
jgi:lipoprotein-anchoring transpeptidase ErfK/SrfK